MNNNKIILFAIISLILGALASPDASAAGKKRYRYVNGRWTMLTDDTESTREAKTSEPEPLRPDTTINVNGIMYPPYYYSPVIFDGYVMGVNPDTINLAVKPLDTESPTYWVDARLQAADRFRSFKQHYMANNPGLVQYNINTLPEAPKQFRAYVDDSNATIKVEEIVIDQTDVRNEVGKVDFKRKNWLNQFDGSVQFSQAYNSPNWYQGGNNNLNVLINAIYNVKLNQAFQPNVMFENTISYKLGLNSAPDDSLRNYSISEDNFQINSKFGIKAAKRWYYSATLQFKTQLLNNYNKNTTDLKAAFLAPGELNLGLGMTYEYSKKNFSINASFAPLSYNLKMCLNNRISETSFGIKEGHSTVSQYGSNIDTRLTWKLAYNINYISRLTAFTNYDYIQSDWEHTLSFSINKYLSTQLYVHLRYDSQGKYDTSTKWHKFQIKEIFSFGFNYHIATA